MIRETLDRASPTPLYHQIVQAIRWRVGTGGLSAGDRLPPIREAAAEWGVNYHTVRRAYKELAQQGWVESTQGSATQVAATAPATAIAWPEDLDQWLDEVLSIGKDRFGLTPEALSLLLRQRVRADRVLVVECNLHQSAVLARQLERAWGIEAIAWPLERTEEPPPVPILGTYFHHAELRRQWPERVEDMHFLALELDPRLQLRIEAAAEPKGTRILRLVEQDPATAREMAAGVTALLSGRFEIEPVVADPEEILLSLRDDELLLVAPRLWDRLSARVREDERVFDVRHVFASADLQRVWRELNRPVPNSRGSHPTDETKAS